MERHAERHHTLRLLTFNKTSQVAPWYLFRVTCRKALQSRHCDIHWCQTAWGRCHMLTNSQKRWRSTLFPKSTIWQQKNDQRLDNWQLIANPWIVATGDILSHHTDSKYPSLQALLALGRLGVLPSNLAEFAINLLSNSSLASEWPRSWYVRIYIYITTLYIYIYEMIWNVQISSNSSNIHAAVGWFTSNLSVISSQLPSTAFESGHRSCQWNRIGRWLLGLEVAGLRVNGNQPKADSARKALDFLLFSSIA